MAALFPSVNPLNDDRGDGSGFENVAAGHFDGNGFSSTVPGAAPAASATATGDGSVVAPAPGATPSGAVATVWVSGRGALVVEQGGSADGGRPFEPHPDGERVELCPLDLGEVFTDERGTEVRVSYVDGTYVRAWSTLPRDEVIALARSLEPGPGGEPEYVDG